MRLGPDLFAHAPALRTYRLAGEENLGADLFFTADERHLVVLDGRIQVWDVRSRRRVLTVRERAVLKVIDYGPPGGLLMVEQDAGDESVVRLVWLAADGSGERVVASGLPAIGDEAVDLCVCGVTAVVATHRWLRCYDLETGTLRGGFSFLPAPGRPNRSLRLLKSGGVPYLRLIRASYLNADADFRRSLWSINGEEVARLSSALPGLYSCLCLWSDAMVAVGPSDGSSAVAVLDSEADLCRACLLRPFRPDMQLSVSRGGELLAGVSSELLAIWKGDELVSLYDCNAEWYGPWLSPDGCRVMLTYRTGASSHINGMLDLVSGRPLGHCNDHMPGCAYAFSQSSRYFASVTDHNNYNPEAGLPNGTVVLTELEGD